MFVLLVAGGTHGGIVPLAWTGSSERLEQLCVVTLSARVVTLTPRIELADISSWDMQRELLHANRRDAIVTALKGAGKHPFEKVDGPCGIRGEVAWEPELRGQVIEYLSRLPTIKPAEGEP